MNEIPNDFAELLAKTKLTGISAENAMYISVIGNLNNFASFFYCHDCALYKIFLDYGVFVLIRSYCRSFIYIFAA